MRKFIKKLIAWLNEPTIATDGTLIIVVISHMIFIAIVTVFLMNFTHNP